MRIEPVYSPDDGGWYCEVVNTRTGATLYTTSVYNDKGLAIAEARVWVRNH